MRHSGNLWAGRPTQGVLTLLLVVAAFVPATVRAQTTSDGSAPAVAISEYLLPTSGSLPGVITVGPDDALWFYETGGNQIGRITLDGAITELPIPTPGASLERQGFLARAADGALWFTENAARRLERISVDGNITEYPIPDSPATAASQGVGLPLGAVAAGPDGAVWVTEGSPARLGRRASDETWRQIALPQLTVCHWA